MIYIYLHGHKYKHDIRELIKVFFPFEELDFLGDVEDKGKYEYLLDSRLIHNRDISVCEVKLYKYGDLIYSEEIDILDNMIEGYEFWEIAKISIKRSIYNSMLKISQTDAPWGILTGIRPMKIIHRLLDSHISNNDIMDILIRHYRLDKEKASLLSRVSHNQRGYIYPLKEDKYSLYISIPFCPSRCLYCSFPSLNYQAYDYLIKDYVKTLIYELAQVKEIMKGKELNTLYIGGGTPTSIRPKEMERILKAVNTLFNINKSMEFTVEAGRPDTIDYDMLKILKDNGVNRISINPQSMNDKTLKAIGRNHKVEDIINAYKLAKNFKFDIINMDLILGLPGEGLEELNHSLSEIEKLEPDNLTVHTLALKRGSRLKDNKKKYDLSDGLLMDKMMKEVEEYIGRNNLIPYYLYRQKEILGNLENIGYSKVGKECIYNISMMEEKETIIGVGMGAVSKIFNLKENYIERIPNFKDINEYLSRIDELILRKKKAILK